MPAGLQVWDSGGNLIIDITTRCGCVLGSAFSSTSIGNFTVTDEIFTLGTPYYLYLPYNNINVTNLGITIPTVSFSGSTMTVTANGCVGTIMYGVY